MSFEQTPEALIALGWDPTFQRAFDALGMRDVVPARIVAQHRSGWIAAGAEGECRASLSGRVRHDSPAAAELPTTGDWVAIATPQGAGATSSIRAVLPRRSAFLRRAAGTEPVAQVIAANIDIACIVTALPDDLNVRRLERYLTLVWESGAAPLIVLSKCDLCHDLEAAMATLRRAALAADVVPLSALTGAGIASFEARLTPRSTVALLGSSGVGKSTLVNRLVETDRMGTQAVRGDGRGRHTTTHRELVRLPTGAFLIDTPGMRELQLWGDGAGLAATFADMESLARDCHFANCHHVSEPGCAVLAAVAAGGLAPDRLDHWRQLQRELRHLARQEDPRLARAARAGARSAQRALRAHLRRKYED